MTGCWAPNCKNRSDNGIKFVCFPSNPERRNLWIKKVGRYDVLPTTNSCLCEYHFTADMWEKPRVDGKRKLKINAVPTIFNNTTQKSSESFNAFSTKTEIINKDNKIVNYQNNENEAEDTNSIVNSDLCDNVNWKQKYLGLMEKYRNIEKKLKQTQNNYEARNKALQKTYRLYSSMKKTVNKLKSENEKLKLIAGAHDIIFKKVFAEDQIRALSNKLDEPMHWSNETIEKALELKFACGNAGYDTLLKHNIPLPSRNTLETHVGEFSDDCYYTVNMNEHAYTKRRCC